MINTVPSILAKGSNVHSDASLPRHIPDNCSCWPENTRRAVARRLRKPGAVKCLDATAHAAVTSLALSMMLQGKPVLATIGKEYREALQ